MNRKGVFLTFMVFLLIGAALALNLVLRQSSVREERTAIEESAFREVNETFNSIYSQILEERTGYAGDVQKRYLAVGAAPTSGGTSFSVTQQVPPKTTVSASDIVDALNLFSVFLSNKNISQDLDISAYVPDAFNAQAWGTGTENPDVGFLIQPYCVRYLPLKVGVDSGPEFRFMGFEVPSDWEGKVMGGPLCDTKDDGICFDWGCKQVFDIANIERIDINFFVGKKGCGDYPNTQNDPDCRGSFDSGGKKCYTSFESWPHICGTPPNTYPCCGTTSPYHPCPVVDINIMETEIEQPLNCFFSGPTCIRRAKGYLDYAIGSTKDNSVKLQINAVGGGITLNLLDQNPEVAGRVYLFSYSGQNTCLDNNAVVNITFKGPTWVDMAGFEFAVSKPGFDLCRKTKYGTCPGEAAVTCIPGGAPQSCGPKKGVCVGATQTCVAEVWGSCSYLTNSLYDGSTELRCSDTYDNDCDGLTNCKDPNCNGLSGGTGLCQFGTEVTCNDSFDNDGDGQIDCADHTDCDGKIARGGGTCPASCSNPSTCNRSAGENYLNCPQDCCNANCTAVGDLTLYCMANCNGYNNCTLTAGCSGKYLNNKFCDTPGSYVTCCNVAPTPCGSGKYCSGTDAALTCYNCLTYCDGICQSSACYGTTLDPDCDTAGGATLPCCGNGTCDAGENAITCEDDCLD